MVSIGFPDSTAGAAASGAKVVCAAAIPASSNTQNEAVRILIEDLPLPDHLATRLQFQMRPPEFQLAEHDLFFDHAD
jgi:hypothetical protein